MGDDFSIDDYLNSLLEENKKQQIEETTESTADKYKNMLNDIKGTPIAIGYYREFIRKILIPTGVELMIDGDQLTILYGGDIQTDFGIVVLGVRRIYDLEEEHYELELLILSHLAEPKTVKINLLDLDKKLWLNKLGVNYMSDEKSTGKIKEMIKIMARYAPETVEYNYTGWSAVEDNTYILDGQVLRTRDLTGESNNKQVCEHTLQMLNVAERRLTIPMLAIVLLSLVHSQMILLGEYFKGVVCLLAQSQSFKTTISGLFFDLINGHKADINFDSTEIAMVRVIGKKRDAVCIVDDLKPASTSQMKRNLLSKIEKIIRMCADDSSGYQRAAQKNSTISNMANGIVVITAEEIPVNVYSTLARLLVFEMNRQSVDKEKLTHFQAEHGIYRAFIESYICFIGIQGVSNYCSNLKHRFLGERDVLRSKLLAQDIQVDPRTNDMIAWLSISFSEFLKYALSVEAIDQEQFDALGDESEKIFLDIMAEQAERINELDDITRFFKGLSILLDTREANIEHLQARNSGYLSAESKAAIGFKKKGFVYLKNGVAYQQVSTYYRRNGKEFAIAETSLRRMLHDNRYIISYKSKSPIHRLHVNGESYQCTKFEEATFNRLLEGGKNNGSGSEREFQSDRILCENASVYLGRTD